MANEGVQKGSEGKGVGGGGMKKRVGRGERRRGRDTIS